MEAAMVARLGCIAVLEPAYAFCDIPNGTRGGRALVLRHRDAMESVMKKTLIASAACFALFGPAHAEGCLKGAAVGGVVGHVAGHHAVIGGAAGCAVGAHHAKKKEEEKQKKEKEQEQRAREQQQRTPRPASSQQ